MDFSKVSATANYYGATSKTSLLAKAVKAYQDEKLTGLTDDERDEIKKRVDKYLKEHPIQTKQDHDALCNYVKSLMKKFGFKGDLDEGAAAILGEILDKQATSGEQPAEICVAQYNGVDGSVYRQMAVENKLFL